MAVPITHWMGTTPRQLRMEIRNDRSRNMQLRRGVTAVSLLGIATMAATTLLQMGVFRRLPDPPIGNFDTRKVNTSDEAYSYGGPDSPVNILAHAVNLLIASTGSPERARKFPWLPIMAAAVEAPQTAVAAKYLFHQMPKVDKAWCPYCIVDALTHFATFGLLLPEAREALGNLRDRGRRAV